MSNLNKSTNKENPKHTKIRNKGSLVQFVLVQHLHTSRVSRPPPQHVEVQENALCPPEKVVQRPQLTPENILDLVLFQSPCSSLQEPRALPDGFQPEQRNHRRHVSQSRTGHSHQSLQGGYQHALHLLHSQSLRGKPYRERVVLLVKRLIIKLNKSNKQNVIFDLKKTCDSLMSVISVINANCFVYLL